MRVLTKGLFIFHDYQNSYNGERNYECSDSWKNINQWSNPHKLQRTQLSCNHYKCERVFDQSSNLIIHQTSHIVENTNKCSLCDKSLNQTINHIEHWNIHSGEEPYKCTAWESL